jgi:hypothetical protein
MDPKATFLMIHNAIQARDYAQAVSSIAHYYDWRVKGGAPASPFSDEYVLNYAIQLADLLEDLS